MVHEANSSKLDPDSWEAKGIAEMLKKRDEEQSPESREALRDALARWIKLMDEHPDVVTKVPTWDPQSRKVDVLALESGARIKTPLWIARKKWAHFIDQEVTLIPFQTIEIPASRPNPGLSISQQSIKPGIYEYTIDPEKDWITKWWRHDHTVVTFDHAGHIEPNPTSDELDGLSQLLKSANLVTSE